MRNKIYIILATIMLSVLNASAIDRDVFRMTEAFKKWEGDKYSLFIHFGLYSQLDGMWRGVPATGSGSEMIQSAAGIHYDVYEEISDKFNPQGFNAEEIVALAKKAGMRSIIFTAKHHDGFCMFKTETTDFNSADATPSGRDFVQELSEVCQREGIKFGIYFSLLDWHSPYGSHMSSHNADKISDTHHKINLEQVQELVLKYGDISEFWFDKGSLTPQQSQDLYDLIKKFQPYCMVSDRLGNDCFDFAITSESRNEHIGEPWQAFSPMFQDTWGWRGWQYKGDVTDKISDKLRGLISTVSQGGNYIINVSLDKDGRMEQFEKIVLNKIGGWLEQNGQAIYDTDPSPFTKEFDWGYVTTKNKTVYLILSGDYPAKGEIIIPSVESNKLTSIKGLKFKSTKSGNVVKVNKEWFEDSNDIKVLEATYKYKVQSQNSLKAQKKGIILDRENAAIDHSHSGFDYYTSYRSETGYTWSINRSQIRNLYIYYSKESLGKKVTVTAGSKNIELELDRQISAELNFLDVDARTNSKITELSYCKVADKTFDTDVMDIAEENRALFRFCSQDELRDIKVRPMQSVLVKGVIYATKAGYKLIEVEAGNGVEVAVNGTTVMKHMNPYDTKSRKESVLLKLKKGRNEVVLRSYNRFGTKMDCYMEIDPKQFLYRKSISLGKGKGTEKIKLWAGPEGTPHHDAELHNYMIFTKSE